MRTLELFAGTQSFTKAVLRKFPDSVTVTLDILPNFKPTIRMDIMEWNYREFEPGSFDVVWCSPPCDQYSSAKTIGKRDLVKADGYVKKCFEIIDYFKPRVWILENPATGLLPRRIDGLRPGIGKPAIADYCAYGKPYRKRTAFWSNIHLRLDMCSVYCPFKKDGRHISVVGGTGVNGQKQVRNIWERDSIPESLVNTIVMRI